MLLCNPVEKGETKLPSPYSLRRKILLKHKKLPEGQEESSLLINNDGSEMDLRNSVKSGVMYIEDKVDKEWNPHFFILTPSKIFYTNNYKFDQETERSEDEEDAGPFHRPKCSFSNEELHFSEKWFHGKLANGRKEAEQLLSAYSHLGRCFVLKLTKLLNNIFSWILYTLNVHTIHFFLRIFFHLALLIFHITAVQYFLDPL